jgi:hypothetical protein
VLTPIVFLLFLNEVDSEDSDRSFAFYFGSYKMLNMITLYIISPKFVSSSLAFIVASGFYSAQFKPKSFDYQVSNFFFGVFWIICLKYLIDRNKRQKFRLMK